MKDIYTIYCIFVSVPVPKKCLFPKNTLFFVSVPKKYLCSRLPINTLLVGNVDDLERGEVGAVGERDVDLGEWMVRSGFAMALRSQSPDYVVFEDSAREEEIGMWAGPFIPPWDWRAGQR